MDRDTWKRVEAVFLGVLERPEEERAAHLDEACAGDGELRAAVEALLRHHAEEGGVLDEPPLRVPEAGLPEDREIGSYRLEKLLGRGGMGEVYLATQVAEGFRRSVALKVIRRGMGTDEVLRRFQLERQILANLSHPNLAQLLDGGATADGRPYFVMEFVDGVRIDEYCDRRQLTIPERLQLFLAVCDAVQHAHQNLIVHRDLKPGNVLVTADGVPKLLDFGIGKILSLDAAAGLTATRPELRVLTPGYAAPEQIRGDAVTAATDVYGLGILLFELLTGHHPTEEDGASLREIERSVLEEDPPRPSGVVSRISGRKRGADTETITPELVSMHRRTDPHRLRRHLAGDLDNVVLKALNREAGRRYATASALAEDLRRYLDGRPIKARPDSFAYRAGKFVRRHRLPLGAAAAVALSLVGATAYSVGQSRRVAEERDQALEVEGFLLEMFGSSGPDAGTGNTVTARQLLDRQVEVIDGFADQPELKGRMAWALAEGYDRLGLLAESERLARESLDLRRASRPPGDVDIAQSMGLLGWVLHESGRSDEGEALLRESIPMWRKARDPAGLSRALNDLGVIREAAGDYDEAEGLYREALELRRERYGEDHRAFAVTASNLSVIYYRKGDYGRAVAAAQEALEAMRRALGPDHQRSIVIQSNLAGMQMMMGDIQGALLQYQDLAARQERLQGPDHPTTLRLLSSVAQSLRYLGRSPEALGVYRRVAEAQERRLGPTHPDLGVTLNWLGQVLVALDQPEEARAYFERALDILVAAYGEDHERVAYVLEGLGGLRLRSGELEAGEATYRRALASIEAALGPNNTATAGVRLRFGEWLVYLGRAREALAYVRQAHEAYLAALPSTHIWILNSRLMLADTYARLDSLRIADSLLAAAPAPDPTDTGRSYRALMDSVVARVDSVRTAR